MYFKAIHLNGSLLNDRNLRVSRAVNRPKQTLTVLEKKKKTGPFKSKGAASASKKKSFTKMSKAKQKGVTEESYQGTHIRKKSDKHKRTNKWLNKSEKRKNIISKKLAMPTKPNKI